jgi:hypothetical protein
MPDPDQSLFTSIDTSKDIQASPVGAGVAEPSDYPYLNHEKTLKWIRETKEKLPRATPKMREDAFLADGLIKGTIFPYLKNTLLKGGKVETKDNKLYSAAIEEITDWLEYIELLKAFRDDYLYFGFLDGYSYRRIDPDRNGDIVRLEFIEPSAIEIYQDSWDSSIVAYLQHARVDKDWSKYGTKEDVDSWFIPFTLRNPEIPLTIEDIYLTHVEGREIGNNPKVLELFNLYKNKYNITLTTKLRVAAAERIIAMRNSPVRQKHNSYYDDDEHANTTHAPIDPVIPAIWLKQLLIMSAPNLIYSVLSPFIHVVSGILKESKDLTGKPIIISSTPQHPNPGLLTQDPTTYNNLLANYNAWLESLTKAGKKVVDSLKNGGAYVSGPDIALKVIESSRSASHQFVKGLIDLLDEEIGHNFGFPMALVKATGTELASSRNISQIFNTVHAGERTEYETVADKLIRKQFDGKVWQGSIIEKDEDGNENTTSYSYTFEEIKAHFCLEIPDTKDLLNEAQVFKTKAEGLVQVKALGASREDLQALGEEAGLGLLGLDNFDAQTSPEETIQEDTVKQVAAILKACLAEDIMKSGLISKGGPTDPSGFKDEELTKKLHDAYKTAQETILEVFDQDD